MTKKTKLVKVGEKRPYENITYVCHVCHESFASKTDLYKDYLKHIAFFKCEICKSDKTQFGTRSEYLDMSNQRLMPIDPTFEMWDENESSDDEDDPLDSIVSRLENVKTFNNYT